MRRCVVVVMSGSYFGATLASFWQTRSWRSGRGICGTLNLETQFPLRKAKYPKPKRFLVNVAPHRTNPKKLKTRDGRLLRRYERRWLVERFFAWL
jgi:hypothetical protein